MPYRMRMGRYLHSLLPTTRSPPAHNCVGMCYHLQLRASREGASVSVVGVGVTPFGRGAAARPRHRRHPVHPRAVAVVDADGRHRPRAACGSRGAGPGRPPRRPAGSDHAAAWPAGLSAGARLPRRVCLTCVLAIPPPRRPHVRCRWDAWMLTALAGGSGRWRRHVVVPHRRRHLRDGAHPAAPVGLRRPGAACGA